MTYRYLLTCLLCTLPTFGKNSIPAFINEKGEVTLEGDNLKLNDVLYTLAHLKHLNLTLAPNIEGNLYLHWYNLPWTQAMYTLKKNHHLSIEAEHDQWHIKQIKPKNTWHPLPLNHARALYLKRHTATLKQHLSTGASMLIDPNETVGWLWGNRQDFDRLKTWQEQPQFIINLQLYCLLVDMQGLHDFGLSPNMQETIAPNDWQRLLHKTGWLSMLKDLKTWGIERLITRWVSESQEEGHTVLLARPHLSTLSGEIASIKAGIKLPIQQKNSRGSTTTTYQEASIHLKAEPFANPDHSIDLTLDLTYDWPVFQNNEAPPHIQTRALHTRIVIPSHHTWVLGSIQQQSIQSQSIRTGQIPWLSNWLTDRQEKHSEYHLLIMVVPSITPLKKPAQGGLF